MKSHFSSRAAISVIALALAPSLGAWGYNGHRIIGEAALAALPADFPAYARTLEATDRILFLANGPDRWSHSTETSLHHENWPDHFFDYEWIAKAGLDPRALPPQRFNFAVAFAEGRAAHLDRFPSVDPAKNPDHTDEWAGFLPWAIVEEFDKLKLAFGSLKVYQQYGTPAEVANGQADIIYEMGILAHYVGDSSQPLHVTEQFNGWVGPNPKGFTTWSGIHVWIDGSFISKAGIRFASIAPRVKPAAELSLAPRADRRDPLFSATMEHIAAVNATVETLYQLEKDGKLNHDDKPANPEGMAFIESRLLDGGETLAAMWLAAWRTSTPDTYLLSVYQRRDPQPAPAPKSAP